MKKLPKTLYVSRENEGTDDEYFDARQSAEGLEDGQVGIYTLTEVKNKSTHIELK